MKMIVLIKMRDGQEEKGYLQIRYSEVLPYTCIMNYIIQVLRENRRDQHNFIYLESTVFRSHLGWIRRGRESYHRTESRSRCHLHPTNSFSVQSLNLEVAEILPTFREKYHIGLTWSKCPAYRERNVMINISY